MELAPATRAVVDMCILRGRVRAGEEWRPASPTDISTGRLPGG